MKKKKVANVDNRDLLLPIKNVHIVSRSLLVPNDYNPNKVLRQNLDLLTESILNNGWTMPIVVRRDNTIVDGFHRWTVSGEEPLFTRLKGMVPVVYVDHATQTNSILGTITHNRARGTHLLEPMEKIVKQLLAEGKTVDELERELGMKKEEVFRLSGIDRMGFLELMSKGKTFSPSYVLKYIDAKKVKAEKKK